jgi:hypothetical protein
MRARHIRKELERQLEVKTLQPGYLVITYDPEMRGLDPSAFKIRNWEEMRARGFHGGICFPRGVDVRSWTDEELSRAGLQRIPAQT